ncbi:MAG: hypothetical protein QG553_152 [Patescibacteria group bacterium]|nr:hypothetical protein [Patescibacteria group bacterium]
MTDLDNIVYLDEYRRDRVAEPVTDEQTLTEAELAEAASFFHYDGDDLEGYLATAETVVVGDIAEVEPDEELIMLDTIMARNFMKLIARQSNQTTATDPQL